MEREIGVGSENLGEAVEQGKAHAADFGERARQMASDAAASAQNLAQRAREQAATATDALRASPAGDALYRQGAQASTYVSRNVAQYPLSAVLIAAAVGYGLALLIHNR